MSRGSPLGRDSAAEGWPAPGLPPIDQVGLVVRSVKEAVTRYEPLFGPFVILDNGPFDAMYRGRPERAHLVVAFGRSGGLEVELVEWVAGAVDARRIFPGSGGVIFPGWGG